VKATSFTLSQIAERLGCSAPSGSNASLTITGPGALNDAGPSEISFLSSKKYLRQFIATKAGAVIVSRSIKLRPTPDGPEVLLVDDAEAAMSRVLEMFAPPVPHPPPGVDALARVDSTANLADGVCVGPFVIIGPRSRIGSGSILHAGVYIGDDVTIGNNCQLFPHVTVRERITIGNRVVIHANSALGTDGFGYRWDGTQHAKVPQIGSIIIEDDVEIGSCVCIDRAKFGVTRIGRGSKIDNLVQVAHNVTIGPHCIIAGQAGMAGSVKLGPGAMLGGQCAIRDHVTIGAGSMVGGGGGVMNDVPNKSMVSGIPAAPHRQWLREQAALKRLPDLIQQVRHLQTQLKKAKGK
jgi:UDP-3-O-[3-hydroxymyristoyl] glucosamine N-acyltransferase